MTTTPDGVPDVVALDESGGVIHVWHGCPDVTDLSELPADNRVSQIAIATAHLIRRRDGVVLKGALPDGSVFEAPVEAPEPTHLERVDLIPPPEELEQHEPLGDNAMALIALYTVLSERSEGAELYMDDRDIVKALKPGAMLSIERQEEGTVVVRAHSGSLAVINLSEAADG